MHNVYDVGIIGMGVGGAFAAYKLAKEYKNIKMITFDIGRPPAKRRRQIDGFLGCLPNSDGKLYMNNIQKVSEIVGLRKIKSSYNQFTHILNEVDTFKIIKDKSPSISMEKKLKKSGYDIFLNDYIQIYPKDIHILSKHIAEILENHKNITFCYDKEVTHIYKQKNIFTIITEDQEYKCKKVIIAVGRSGWRWAKELYSTLGIVDNNDTAHFGIRVEMNSGYMKDFNKSNCTIIKNDIEIGPLSWFGTIIPEDHIDMAISAFRSNENRWKTDKVSFSLIGNKSFPKEGFEQTDRMAKLTFLLANDRIIKEKISHILTGKSKISIIKEYDWLKDAIQNLMDIIPDLYSKAYFHIPTILPTIPKINIGSNLETEINGMFVIGESAGVHGILSAACMGIICADTICK